MSLAVRVAQQAILLTGALAVLTCGCTQLPHRPFSPSTQVRAEDLASHVEFLTQPSLKGRKCRSMDLWSVRHYIRQHFEQAGLQPWAKTHSFDQSFTLGTNVIGIRPGSDKKLADQIILVCADYDGPGIVKGRICPGAADGAAATAALLEIAQRLPANGHRLRRTIAFAAFDCGQERSLGAFAFTCRKDFDPSKIVAVIDLNMLGRPLFGVVENTLIAIGATDYPEVRRTATESAQAVSLRIVSAGADLAGPLGDSFAFQHYPIPSVLFTTGLYFDYYKPTDTADKIDYVLLERVTRAAARTITSLAGRETIGPEVRPQQADREELQGIITVLEEIRSKAAVNDLTPAEVQNLDRQISQAKHLLGQKVYTFAERSRFIATLMEQDAPSVVRFLYDKPKPPPQTLFGGRQLAAFLKLHAFFARYGPLASRGLQQVVRHFTEGWTFFRLLGSYTYSACDVRDDQIVCRPVGDQQYQFGVLYPHMTIQAGLATRKVDVQWSAMDTTGSHGELVDFCLLTWSNQQDDCLNSVMPRVLEKVTGQSHGQRYQDWLEWRTAEVKADSEAAWLQGLWQSDNPELLKALLVQAASSRRTEAPPARLVEIIRNPKIRSDVRAAAIGALPATAGNEALLALADLVTDHTPAFRWDYLPAFDRSFPFYDNIVMQMDRRFPPPHEQVTLGQAAQRKLVAITGQNFDANVQAWKDWIGQR